MTRYSTPAVRTDFLIRLTAGNAEAQISPLAAGLRSYRRNGVQLSEPATEEAVAPGGSGLALAPWPNRVEDGKWLLDGVLQQLDITEVARGHAIHGLLRNTEYSVAEQTGNSVLLTARIYPQHGYPFQLLHRVQYSLTEAGSLEVRQRLTNESAAVAPVALGAHPYLRLGDLPAEELTLTVPARRYLLADAGLIPRGRSEVGPEADLRAGRLLAELDLDCAYTELAFDSEGWFRSTLSAADGRRVSLRQNKTCQFVHIFVTAGYPGRNKAVAIEPMSAPANAFNSGDGLRWLEPGASFGIEWGIESEL